MGDSRSTAVERWFLGLQPAEREAVVTVKDVESATLLRKMLNLNSVMPSSSTRMFYFVDALQRRKFAGYGSWFVGSRSPKLTGASAPSKSPRVTLESVANSEGACPPPTCQLAVRECPSHLAISEKMLDAAWRLEKLLRLDFTDTLSVPWHGISDQREAKDVFRCLIALAGPVKAKSSERSSSSCMPASYEHGVCKYFTVASFAASMLMARILSMYTASRQESKRSHVKSWAMGARHSDVSLTVDPKAFVVRLATLFRDCPNERERTRWELAGARAVLKRQLDAKDTFELSAAAQTAAKAKSRGAGAEAAGAGRDGHMWGKVESWAKKWSYWDHRVELAQMSAAPTPPESESPPDTEDLLSIEAEGHVLWEAVQREEEGRQKQLAGWSRPTLRSMEPWGAATHRDQVDCLDLLLAHGAGYGPLASRFKWVVRFEKEVRGQVHVLDILASAPLAHAAMHCALFQRAWQQRDGELQLDVIAALHAKQSASLPPVIGAKSRAQAVARPTVAARAMEPAKAGATWGLDMEDERDALIVGHDQEWTQLGRIEDVQRHVDAEFRAIGGLGFNMAPHSPSGLGLGLAGAQLPSAGAGSGRTGNKEVVRKEKGGSTAAKEAAIAPQGQEERGRRMERGGRERKDMSLGESSSEDSSLDHCDEDSSDSGSEHGGWVEVSEPPNKDQYKAEPEPGEGATRRRREKRQEEAADSHDSSGADTTPSSAPAHPADEPPHAPLCSGADAVSAAMGFPLASPSHSCEELSPPTTVTAESRESSPSTDALVLAYDTPSTSPESSSAPASPDTAPLATPPMREWFLHPLRPQYPPFASLPDAHKATAKRLHAEVEAFLTEVEPVERSRRERQKIVEKVEAAVRSCWESASVEVYGSFATGLYLPHSDVDIVVMKAQASPHKSALQLLADKLKGMRWCRNMNAIETASVPVIKLTADTSLLDTAADGGQRDGSDGEESGREGQCIAVDVTLYSDKEHLQSIGVSYSPIDCREFAVAELQAYPVVRPLVLVLKQLLFHNKLNDSYSGGLSSHSLLLLLIFFFRLVRSSGDVGQDCQPGEELMAALDGDIPADCRYGEWLLRVLQWLSEFPFDSIGIAVSCDVPGISFLGRDQDGLAYLTGQLPIDHVPPEARRPMDILHLEDPFNQDINVAKASFRWYQVCSVLTRAWQLLKAHHEAAPHTRIFGGVSEVQSPLATLFSVEHAPAMHLPRRNGGHGASRSVTPEGERGGGERTGGGRRQGGRSKERRSR